MTEYKTKRISFIKQDIKSIPFDEVIDIYKANASDLKQLSAALTEFAEKYSLKERSWVAPQLFAVFGNWHFADKDTLKVNLGNASDWERGVYLFSLYAPRGVYVLSQVKEPQYSTLVPIILSSLKKYKNVPYSAWSIEGLVHVLEPALLDAVLWADQTRGEFSGQSPYGTGCELSSERLLQLRVEGLVYRSGKNCGEVRNPSSSFKLYHTRGTELEGVPWLAQVMLTQIWVAHPDLRTPYMILNPYDLDRVPCPLISAPISFKPKNTIAQDLGAANTPIKLPW